MLNPGPTRSTAAPVCSQLFVNQTTLEPGVYVDGGVWMVGLGPSARTWLLGEAWAVCPGPGDPVMDDTSQEPAQRAAGQLCLPTVLRHFWAPREMGAPGLRVSG